MIFDTLSGNEKQLEISAKVRMYICGVTVYDESHIGHARTIIVFDVIQRYLESIGTKVEIIVNFTDVDDKIIKRAKRLKKQPLALASSFEKTFYEDMKNLKITWKKILVIKEGPLKAISVYF